MSVEIVTKLPDGVTVNISPQEWQQIQQAVKLLQEFESSVARSFEPKTINFDTKPDGSSISSGTNLTQDQLYSAWGVTFSVLQGSGPDKPAGVFAAAAVDAPSPPNVCSVFAPPTLPPFSEEAGTVKATFSGTMHAVSIDFVPTTSGELLGVAEDTVYLKGFNAAGSQVTEDTYQPGVTGDFSLGTLNISRSEHDISSVEFSVGPGSTGQHVIFAEFDNLWFSQLP